MTPRNEMCIQHETRRTTIFPYPFSKAQKLFVMVSSSGEKPHKINSISHIIQI